ncbi:DUF397 domain-containing protein [Actinacidiphila rubida]|uniref:DUF397 domain-containing protein n=1 Tax=Actinacidiphila rubida TaxID=310780 RepID=A0A1H8QYJ8_9ACTN|nr:DUF397 domain-containing protein [Actinacidiphila rubida]SEO59265.1 protein of unknown function [Actinacidiphila rubida]
MRDTERPDLNAACWHKSSYSNEEGAECVEVARNVPGAVPVRDSKDPQGPALVFGADAWSAFLAGLAAGDFRG